VTQFSTLYTSRLDEELGTDDSTTLFTTARRKAAINRGLEQFAELTECYVRWSTLVITSTAAEYDLNTRSPRPILCDWRKRRLSSRTPMRAPTSRSCQGKTISRIAK
jgi:hypothetical protein